MMNEKWGARFVFVLHDLDTVVSLITDLLIIQGARGFKKVGSNLTAIRIKYNFMHVII